MILTINSLIVPTLRVGGLGGAVCTSAATMTVAAAIDLMGGESTRSALISRAGGQVITRHALVLITLLGSAAVATAAQTPAPATQPAAEAKPNDYADETNWLCRPGRKGDEAQNVRVL